MPQTPALWVALVCDALGEASVVRATGTEAMNALPLWTLDLLHPDPSLDLDALIGAPALLAFGHDDGPARTLPLLVTEARYQGDHRDGHRFGLTLSSPLSRLSLRSGYRVFQDLTTQAIVDQLLHDAGFPTSSISFRLGERYGRRTYCVQYGETECAFLSRLLADDGINYWHDHADDGEPLLVFGDGAASHDPIPGKMTLHFEDASGLAGSSADAFFALSRTLELAHDRVHVRDFDVRAPDVPIEGTAGQGPLEHYEFPACVPNAEAAAARARIRLEQLQRFAVQAEGHSACARLQPGRVVRIEGAADDILNGDHLIVEVHHAIVQATPNEAVSARPYTNRAVMVPLHDQRTFRPDLPCGAPRVDGLETAMVTGPRGEEIHVDDLGCIKVRFAWDRSGIGDHRSSRWVRSLQMAMGGSMLLPRVGWEVPIAYVDGNPDKPFALGRLYNGGAPPPYGLPGKKATSTLQSATSPSDGTTQEIRLGDDAGSMELFVHATRDQTVSIGGKSTVRVAGNETHAVQKSSKSTIHGSQTTTIAGSQSVTVGADVEIAVKGTRAEAIGGAESIGVTGTLTVVCKGAYTETIGGLYALRCNQSNSVIQGAFSQTVGGPMALTAALGINQAIAGARLEQVGGACSILAAASYAESVTGPKKITAGTARETAGTDVVTNVTGIGSIRVGGNATIETGGILAIEAPTIAIKVGGALTAKAGGTLEVGGKVKVSGGRTKIDAQTTRKTSTSKVGT